MFKDGIQMRVAIVHYWLLDMRGGERVVEALCRLIPDADIFTLFYDPEKISETIKSHVIKTSYLQPLRRVYKSLLPLMPAALESLDLRAYDLVISSESGPAKGVLVPSTTRHVCYCHTPMRYLWNLYPAYRNDWTTSRWKRALMTSLTPSLRLWDYASAARVDDFIATCDSIRQRIWKTYRRGAEIVHPPVAVESFYWKPPEDYYLIVSALVAYKCLDSAVRVFSHNGRNLKIVGEGPEFKALRRMAGSNVEFCGRIPDDELRRLYASCRAFLLPGEEDFGITVVEAFASGKPVIALARGGALDTVPLDSRFGGFLYPDATDQSLQAAVESFEQCASSIIPSELQAYAANFSEAEFARKMQRVLFANDLPRGIPSTSEKSLISR
jgi:glycosyltransferase involved in cell wall biosynthesis